ncbi:head maturation protease, ClpP-related [Lacticaseibacillus parakribbianus]|uniref:head maturation protease, ClpP-related n=1 Tax=Lacticaseibacillus parakribbianus TaxID=2970927 RepID=UPI0021CB10E4|nr:head maturation protease, ClpP-related [Lacticaseibacillus parakribbianus]
MITIEAHGDVLAENDEYAPMYDFFGIPRISEGSFRRQLAADETDDVTVNISSDGGDVFSASAIYSMLRARPGNVTVNIVGLAASAGSVIAMAGKTVNISPTGALMIHRASTVAQGNTDDMNQAKTMLDQVDQTIVPAYVAKTGKTEGEILDLMVKESWITAKQAVDWGFADSIMFDDAKPQVAASASHRAVPNSALDRMRSLFDKLNPTAAPAPQPTAKTKPTLRDAKLAILMGREPEEE